MQQVLIAAPQLKSETFKTKFTPKPYHLPNRFAKYHHQLKEGVKSLTEKSVVNSVILLCGSNLGLSQEQALSLAKNISHEYKLIDENPLFKNIPSELPNIFNKQTKGRGHYFIYIPNSINEQTRQLIFLHGFGGNFKFYISALIQYFPNSVIICPSYGVNFSYRSHGYLTEMESDIYKKYKIEFDKPLLLAISGGGPFGFKEYINNTKSYKGFVCIASIPNMRDAKITPGNSKILFLSGSKDKRMPIHYLRNVISTVKQRANHIKSIEYDKDHFFLLSEKKKVFNAIQEFLK